MYILPFSYYYDCVFCTFLYMIDIQHTRDTEIKWWDDVLVAVLVSESENDVILTHVEPDSGLQVLPTAALC